MSRSLLRLCWFTGFYLSAMATYAQTVTECPQNIGFENGTFLNWECSSGSISGTGRNFPDALRPATISLNPSGPGVGQNLIHRGSGNDFYGGFTLDSPNGSDYVVQLGNAVNGRGAEAITYTIVVPQNADGYTVIFSYAVVFENPNHEFDEQPKFTAVVKDLTTGTSTSCGSFEFTAPGAGGGLPGFQTSYQNGNVLYKPWSPVMVNLKEYMGHTISLQFTTNDCSRGGHFGYAYIDFNENCSIPITGNITCPDVQELTLKAITGFAGYEWFDVVTSQVLGNSEQLKLRPVPPRGTKIGIRLTPYAGLGCEQTLSTTISEMVMNINDPPEKCSAINITTTYTTVGSSSDLTYTYWKDIDATKVVEDPKHIVIDGTYYIKGTSSSGCFTILPVKVKLIKLKPIDVDDPKEVTYPVPVDITRTYIPQQGLTYSYWTDSATTQAVKYPTRITLPGRYYIRATSAEGCTISEPVNVLVKVIGLNIPNAFTPNGDGINDNLPIVAEDNIAIKLFTVYNRWGDLLYQTTDINKYWDGRTRDGVVPVGVYYYIVEGEDKRQYFRRAGYITVIK